MPTPNRASSRRERPEVRREGLRTQAFNRASSTGHGAARRVLYSAFSQELTAVRAGHSAEARETPNPDDVCRGQIAKLL